METILLLIGSGGAVTIVSLLLQHWQKLAELDLKKKEIDEKIGKIVTKKEIPLEYHPIFATLDEIEFYFLRVFNLPDKGRTLIIREFAVNKIRTWRRIIKTNVMEAEECDKKCSTTDGGFCNKSENTFKRMLLSGLEEYSSLWTLPGMRDVYGKITYDPASIQTMQVFIPIFNDWHRGREEAVRSASHDIPASGLNESCIRDWWDVLSVYQYAFIQMKYDVVGAMQMLNGEISGLEFLGVTIGEINY